MPRSSNKSTRKKPRLKQSGASQSYDELKEFAGRKYTGMKVGRGHKWQYAAGEWVEKKLTPDQWEFRYAVNKQRHGKAPAGSGVPVGTAYHWYILADQTVTKLDANTYSTAMSGAKFKLAHKRADRDTWSASERAQRKRLIQILEELITELRAEPEPHPAQQPGLAAQAGTPPETEKPSKAGAASRGPKGDGKRARAASSAPANGNAGSPARASGKRSSGKAAARPALARKRTRRQAAPSRAAA